MDLKCAGILAAGEGVRFRGAGVATPKPLIPIGGVPMIGRCLGLLDRAGLDVAYCVINEESRAILEYVKTLDLRLKLEFVVRSTPSSLHSLFELAPRLLPSGRFFLTTVDAIVAEPDFLGFIRAGGQGRGWDGLLACTSFVQDENPLWLAVDENHRVQRIAPPPGEGSCITAGFYVLSSEMLKELETVRKQGMKRLRNFLQWLSTSGYVFQGHHLGTVVDVDDPADLATAERFLETADAAAARR